MEQHTKYLNYDVSGSDRKLLVHTIAAHTSTFQLSGSTFFFVWGRALPDRQQRGGVCRRLCGANYVNTVVASAGRASVLCVRRKTGMRSTGRGRRSQYFPSCFSVFAAEPRKSAESADFQGRSDPKGPGGRRSACWGSGESNLIPLVRSSAVRGGNEGIHTLCCIPVCPCPESAQDCMQAKAYSEWEIYIPLLSATAGFHWSWVQGWEKDPAPQSFRLFCLQAGSRQRIRFVRQQVDSPDLKI